jgi:hypothetical protein
LSSLASYFCHQQRPCASLPFANSLKSRPARVAPEVPWGAGVVFCIQNRVYNGL